MKYFFIFLMSRFTFISAWHQSKKITVNVNNLSLLNNKQKVVPYIGIEMGGGSPRIDMSEGVTSSQRIYQIEFLNKANRKWLFQN